MTLSVPIIFSSIILVLVWFVMFFKLNKKPYSIQTFFLGACYFLLASFIYRVIFKELNFSPEGASVRWMILIIAFCASGFLEELARVSAVMTESIKNVFSIQDAIWYSFSASLGVALFENIFYAVKFDTIFLQFGRLAFSTAGHLAYGIILGYFIGKAKLCKNWFFLLQGIFITTCLHSAYNILLFQTYLPKILALIPHGIALIVAVKILLDLKKEVHCVC